MAAPGGGAPAHAAGARPAGRHRAGLLAALLLLAGVALVRFHGALLRPTPATDERVYLAAFHALAEGRSPYTPAEDGLDFFYPPTFARLGAWLLDATDERGAVALVRAANFAGLLAMLWLALRQLPVGDLSRALVGAGYLALAPPALVHGFGSGNLSFAAGGATLAALALSERGRLAAFGAGALFAFGSVTKPLAPPALATLVAARGRGARRVLGALAVAVALGGALIAATPFLADYLSARPPIDDWPLRRSVSLYRALHLAGLPTSPLGAMALVFVGVALVVRGRFLDPARTTRLALVATALAAPALWSHTLLVTLPLQTAALARAVRRLRAPRPRPALARWELPLVTLAVLALQLVDGIGGGVETSPALVQLAAIAVPLAAPAALAAYLWDDETAAQAGPSVPAAPARVG